MNFKKLAVTGATAALLLSSAAGVFASQHRDGRGNDDNGGVSVSNTGDIRNTSFNVANTGLNSAGGSQGHEENRGRGRDDNKGGSVKTGDAYATQMVTNEINTSASCGCTSSDDERGRGNNNSGNTSVRNSGDIHNLSVNVANTGLNRGGSVNTGDAGAAQDVWNAINTSVGASE